MLTDVAYACTCFEWLNRHSSQTKLLSLSVSICRVAVRMHIHSHLVSRPQPERKMGVPATVSLWACGVSLFCCRDSTGTVCAATALQEKLHHLRIIIGWWPGQDTSQSLSTVGAQRLGVAFWGVP